MNKFAGGRPSERPRSLIFRGWWARRVDEHDLIYEKPDERALEIGMEDGIVLGEEMLKYLLSEVQKYPGTRIAIAEVWTGNHPLRPEDD